MEKYSVLLVDDEEEVFTVIRKKLDWEGMGFHVAGYARNGVEALEMADELLPDVVMTDIKMPYMDGLTLSRRLKERFGKIKIIIFSGFDEFEYAKEAIKIEAEEYILKPINSGELQEVFERVKANLDRELDEKRNLDKLRQYYLESLPVLRENFYTSLIEGRIPPDKLERYMASCQVQLQGPFYLVTILHISTTGLQPGVDPFLLVVSVQKLAEEQLIEQWNCRMFTYLGDTILIAQLPDTDSVSAYTDALDRFCSMTRRVCNAVATAGIGHLCREIADLARSYQGARNAISYRVLYGNARAINIAEIEPQENVPAGNATELSIQKIFKMIKMGTVKELEPAVAECVDTFAGNHISIQEYRIYIMELVADLFRFSSNNHLNPDKIFGADSDVYSEVIQLDSTEALKEWLLLVSNKMREMVLSERQDNTSTFVARALEYVREHFADSELTVETVCSQLGISTSYFSTMFKKVTGKTFVNYLTEYRMEAAVELLLTGNAKTYVIAEQTGYSDPNYFSYVFKKQFGMSPSKYRAEKLGERE